MRFLTDNLMYKNYSLDIKEFTDEGTFCGYGAVFDNVDDYGDVILPGAFTKTISAKTPVMLWQHSSSEPIGVYEAMKEDNIGLWLEGRLLLDIPKAKEAHILLKNRAIRGLSIGYVPVAWEWEKRDDNYIRKLKEIDLWEVSLVTFPANPKALVDDVKSIQEAEDVRAAQKLLNILKGSR